MYIFITFLCKCSILFLQSFSFWDTLSLLSRKSHEWIWIKLALLIMGGGTKLKQNTRKALSSTIERFSWHFNNYSFYTYQLCFCSYILLPVQDFPPTLLVNFIILSICQTSKKADTEKHRMPSFCTVPIWTHFSSHSWTK